MAIGILVLKAEKERINLKRQRFERGRMTWLPDEELGKQDKAAKDLGLSRKNPERVAQMARELRWKLKKQQRYMNHVSSERPGDDRLQVLAPVQRSLADGSDEISRKSEWEFKNSNNQMEGKNPQSLVQLALQYYVNLMEKKSNGPGPGGPGAGPGVKAKSPSPRSCFGVIAGQACYLIASASSRGKLKPRRHRGARSRHHRGACLPSACPTARQIFPRPD